MSESEVFQIRDKDTKEILPYDNPMYRETYTDLYGNLLWIYESEDDNGDLVHSVLTVEVFEAVPIGVDKHNG